MRWLDKLLGRPSTSATTAKERLQVIVAHERSHRENPEFLIEMQKEIMDVVAKYISIDQDKIKVELGQKGDTSILELNVVIPEEASTMNSKKPTQDKQTKQSQNHKKEATTSAS